MKAPSLRTTLYLNAAFSTACGLVLLAFTDWLANNAILVPPWVFSVLGIGLLLFAGDVLLTARKLPASLNWAKGVYYADLAWVIATPIALVLLADQLTGIGIGLMIGIAVAVAELAYLEKLGLSREGDATQFANGQTGAAPG